jgi:HK97 family phage prohead protease
MKMKEVRNLEASQAEVRASKDSRLIEGYAIVFNSESRDLGGFREIIKPEAVDGVLENADVLALLNHDQSRGLLARSTKGEGTLTLSVDDKGVRYKFSSPNTSLGDEVLEGVSRGDIRTSSFAFVCADGGQEWRKQEDGTFLRTITAFADIMDVSAVYREAYPDTTVAKRSLDEIRESPEEKPEDKPEDEQEAQRSKTFDELSEYYKQQEAKSSSTNLFSNGK